MFFSTAKLTFPQQNLLSHSKIYFSTAKLTFPHKSFFPKGLPEIRNPEHSESGRKAKITTESNKLNDGDIRLVRYS